MDDSAAVHERFFSSWAPMKWTDVYLVIIIKNVLFLSEQRWSRRMYWERRLKLESWESPRAEEQTKVSSSKTKEKKPGKQGKKVKNGFTETKRIRQIEGMMRNTVVVVCFIFSLPLLPFHSFFFLVKNYGHFSFGDNFILIAHFIHEETSHNCWISNNTVYLGLAAVI